MSKGFWPERVARNASNVCFHASAWTFAVCVRTPSRSNRHASIASGSPGAPIPSKRSGGAGGDGEVVQHQLHAALELLVGDAPVRRQPDATGPRVDDDA